MSAEHEGNEIELLDLGEATVETKQWMMLPLWYDSVFLLGQPDH